jgi:four helix bundle protein
VRAATSIGANYAESQSGASPKDFRHKITISKKESQETQYWLNLLAVCFPDRETDLNRLLDEAEQISKILQTILNKTKP